MQQKPGSLMQSMLTGDPSNPFGGAPGPNSGGEPLPVTPDGTQTTQPVGPKVEEPPTDGTTTTTSPTTPPVTPPNGGTPPVTPPPSHFNTKLMEGDPTKMTPEHAAKSPKYDFLNLAKTGKYNYSQMGDMLKELQSGPNGRLWQGWTADGKGNFVFTGDPKQLAPEWDGVTRVDAVGAYGNLSQGKDPAGWRWGVDDGNQSADMPSNGVDGSNVPSLTDYYNGANSGNGGVGTQMDANQLKSILQKYYGNAASNPGINLGAGTTVR